MYNESTELKPCPFCGGRAITTFLGSQDSRKWRGYIVTKCKTCGGSSKGRYYFGEPIEMPLEDTIGGIDSIDEWNRGEVSF